MIASVSVPTRHQLRVHTKVPETLAVTGRVSAWARAERGTDAPLCFLEGPVVDGQGGVYVVDIAWGRILHISTTSEVTVVTEYDGEPNGLARYGNDGLIVADYRRGIVVVDGLHSGTARLRFLMPRRGVESFRGLNDLVVASDGTVYLTDQGETGLHDPSGRLYRMCPDGRLETVLDNIPSPNGLVLDEANDTIYLAVTRDNAVWRVPLGPHGARKVGRFVQLSGGIGPDGLAQGPDGTLLVAHLGMGVVWVFDDRGVPLLALEAPSGRATTNVAVDDNGRVYVTESDTSTVLTADLASCLATVAPSSQR